MLLRQRIQSGSIHAQLSHYLLAPLSLGGGTVRVDRSLSLSSGEKGALPLAVVNIGVRASARLSVRANTVHVQSRAFAVCQFTVGTGKEYLVE